MSLDWRNSKKTLREANSHIFETGLHSDVIFRIGAEGHHLNSHKIILSSRSEVFSTMFQRRWETLDKDSNNRVIITLENEELDSFKIFLKFLYTDEFMPSVKVDEGLKVLRLAHLYQVQGLVENSVQYLKNSLLNIKNGVPIYLATRVYDDLDLSDAALSFIERNIAKVLPSDEFLEMDEASLSILLKSDDLDIEETELYKGLLRWKEGGGKNSSPKNIETIQSLIMLIRYPLMGAQDFAKIVVPTKLLSDELVIETFTYFAGGRDKEQCKLSVSSIPRKFQFRPVQSAPETMMSVECFDMESFPNNYESQMNPTYDNIRDHAQFLESVDAIKKQFRQLEVQQHAQFKFKTDKDINMYGFKIYGVRPRSSAYRSGTAYSFVNYCICRTDLTLSTSENVSYGESFSKIVQNTDTFDVLLSEPKTIKANTWHWIYAHRITNPLIQRGSGYDHNSIFIRCQGQASRPQVYRISVGQANHSTFRKYVEWSGPGVTFETDPAEASGYQTGIIHSILFKATS